MGRYNRFLSFVYGYGLGFGFCSMTLGLVVGLKGVDSEKGSFLLSFEDMFIDK